MRFVKSILYMTAALIVELAPHSASAQYTQTNLSSDIPNLAANTDPFLQNPWGISATPASPFWFANQATGVATLHFGDGSQASLVVSIPPPAGAQGLGSPTGTVFNPGNGSGAFNRDVFLFSTLGGQIAGWKPVNTFATTEFSSSTNSVYTGLATANPGGPTGPNLYAADFHNGNVNVVNFDGTSFGLNSLFAGKFSDPNLPAGFAPFNIQSLNGQLFVTYAEQDAAKSQPVPGAGVGFIDVFDVDGNLLKRLASNGALNEPWGLAIAPASFGQFGGDLLVGNHGDGTIWAFDSITGLLIGELKDAQGNPIINPGLFALMFGNGGTGFDANALYFSAGLNGGADGLFGEIQSAATPLPAALPMFGSVLGAGGLFSWLRRKRRRINAR